ncbi:MAG: hypothetical protein JW770_07130, partial [Actinobacteria bacterium]|nr:hypothetical protein [Actinomycetota bacterium]
IVTRDTNPEAVIISYKDYLGYKELLKKISELQQDKAFEKSQEQFKKWLKEKGLNIENISDKDISWIIRTLEINKDK